MHLLRAPVLEPLQMRVVPMTETNAKESVLEVFRGHAANLAAAAGKAAAREQELDGHIEQENARLAPMLRDLEMLTASIAESRQILTGLQTERDGVHADAETAAAQGAYAQSVIELAQKASLTETVVDAPEVATNA